ncbi:hypothetical protein KDN32_12105 [Nocardioides sp. J2M5]|uniref:hypothetical protein n=1 Tax=Nocardioides palaemonis TaxID=2829810 RepID=UPI001BAD3A33|nr:hypothetical protein [Nocardioides palaemonis]MBS2938487.1 hypothetical protein [Nocardioides palaemonis]
MSRPARAQGVAVAVTAPALMVFTALVAIGLTGGLSPLGIEGLPDPGDLTRVGLPTVQVLRDLAAMITVGVLVITVTCVGPGTGVEPRALGATRARLVAYAQLGATVWSLSSLALVAFVYSDASGTPVGAPGFMTEAAFFALEYELGQYGLWSAALAAAVAVGCVISTRLGGAGITTVMALVALWPIALTGHAAGTLNHDEAVNLQLFHLVGISVWLGGLVGVILVRRLGGTCLSLRPVGTPPSPVGASCS